MYSTNVFVFEIANTIILPLGSIVQVAVHVGNGTFCIRHFTTRSTPQPVMCGALVCSCMRYGV